ncbi:MAG: GYD domain-containing protein [Chloroflexi bacterium]|nr:GYD domain-containing protein [Chloroflexota bacterium]
MPKYLVRGSYTVDGIKGLLKEGGSARKSHIEQLIRGMGGTVEAFYFAFGGDDVVVIIDLPDGASATALSLAVAAGGAFRPTTTVLITPEEMDQAAGITVSYRPPGQ